LAAEVSTREAVATSLFRSSSSLEREEKANTLHKSKERKRIKDRHLNQQDSRVKEVKKFDFRRIGSRGLPGRILGSRGTRRKKFFDALPLLIKARFFQMGRRRRRSQTIFFQ
jgi:hypothetical protein